MMSWVQTYSGVQFWPLEPRVEDVRLEDIAHALSNQCRFNGMCRKFYSVAQHSILLAAELCRDGFGANVVKAGAFHDSPEAYLPDVCRPIKSTWKEFGEIEARLLDVIFKAMNIDQPSEHEWQTIKHYDDVLLATEKRDLYGKPPAAWVPLPAPLKFGIIPWSPGLSKKNFLKGVEATD